MKKGVTPIVAVSLILLVAVTFGFGIFYWFQSFYEDFQTKVGIKDSKSSLDIIGVETFQTNYSKIYFNMDGDQYAYHIITNIYMNNNSCNLFTENVIDGSSYLYTDCKLYVGSNYKVEVQTNKEVLMKSLTIYR